MAGKGHRQDFDSFPMSDQTLIVLVLGQVYPVESVDVLVLKKTGNWSIESILKKGRT